MNVNKPIKNNTSPLSESKNLTKTAMNQNSKDQVKLEKSAQENATVEIRFLAISWLDEFEKRVFEGKTIDDLIHGNTYE